MVKGRYVFLDGMRGWAAVFVLLYHVFSDGFPVNQYAARSLRAWLPFNGPIAVMAFFVISGFALTVAFLYTRDRKTLLRIGLSRYPRLALPILAACAIVHLALVCGFILPQDQRPIIFASILRFEPTLWHLLKFSLFDVFANFTLAQTYIGPLWTMAYELKGSFLVLAMLWCVGKWQFRWGIYAAFLVLFLYQYSLYSLFIAGVILAELFVKGFWKNSGVNYLAFGLLILSIVFLLYVPWDVNPPIMLCTVALCFGVIMTPQVRQSMEAPISAFLGRISFPLYLVHGPVMFVVGLPLLRSGYGAIVTGIIVVVASFGAALLFTPINEAAMRLSREIGMRILLLTENIRLPFGKSDPTP